MLVFPRKRNLGNCAFFMDNSNMLGLPHDCQITVFLVCLLFQEVEPMGKESDHIHIIALNAYTQVPVRVEYMDRGNSSLNHHDFPEGSHPYIHLLYKPGHYDILYKWFYIRGQLTLSLDQYWNACQLRVNCDCMWSRWITHQSRTDAGSELLVSVVLW